MGFKKILVLCCMALMPCICIASNLTFEEEIYQTDVDANNLSDTVADVYEKLDSIRWNGKGINLAIEGLESISKKAHVAVADDRVILVYDKDLIANYPMPEKNDWKGYGKITTSLFMRIRELDRSLSKLSEAQMYQLMANAILAGLNLEGNYILADELSDGADAKLLTSIGIDGGRDHKNNFRITGVYKGSPADIADIKAGDLITEVNGKRISNMTDGELTDVLSGYNSGTSKLKVLSPFGTRRVTVRKASVVLADADVIHRPTNDTTPGVLEIIIHQVSDNSVAIVQEALEKYTDVGGIILDLRSAVGNNEKSAAKLSGLFVGQKPVMRVLETAFDELEIVPGGDAITDLPVVVLVSNTTRGTPEAVASAFYENHRGVLIGTPTAGNAKLATKIELNNNDVLEIMNKSIKTGTGNKLDGRGVFPLVCLSNIRSRQQQEVFFLNIANNDFDAVDYNKDVSIDSKTIRKACPVITDGAAEDALAEAISVKILTDKQTYEQLMDM